MKARAILAGVLLAAAAAAAQQAYVTPNENLVAEGIPPIPAAVASTAGSYLEYRSAVLEDWHPGRREMLIRTRFGDTMQLHRVERPGGSREQITFFPDAVASGHFHPNGGDYIVFSKDVGGGEWYQLFRYDVESGRVTLLTDGKSRNGFGAWSSSGDRIAYTSTRRTGKDTDVWVMNPADPKTDRLLVQLQGGGWQPLDWSPDDKTILLLEELSINESYLWLVDSGTGEKTELTPRHTAEKISYAESRFSKDGKGIYTVTDRDSEFHRLAYVDLATKSPKYLTSGIPWDVDTFDLSHDGSQIAFATDEDGVSKLHVLDTGSGKQTEVPNLPVGVISRLRWRRDAPELGFSMTTARAPDDCYSLNSATGELTRWTYSESAVKTAGFQEAELVRWKSFDGKMISGFLYKPPARFTGKRPVLVVIHGGPEGQSVPYFLGRNNYFLNELGIALIYPNVRGSTGYGKSFSLLDNGFHREDTYKDINALFDWIAAQPELDAERVAVTGGSYGGHMTLAISTFYSNRIRCSVDVVGMSNLVTFLEHTESYRRDLRRVEYGDERDPQMHEFLEKIAPMNHVELIRKPMMVVAGKNDPRVPVSESEQIVAALQKQGTPVWFLMAKDEGHGFRKKPNQDFQFYATVAFLQKFLLE
ncbi:MAG TPA: alpha/beta fold hydrolase [Patescibacteria group bacterium]|nr:alpha/beta fold hydrolase [Patescibacteria group bacterium]